MDPAGAQRGVDPNDVLDTAAHHLSQRDLALASDPLRFLVQAIWELNLRLDHDGMITITQKRQQTGLVRRIAQRVRRWPTRRGRPRHVGG